MFKVTVPYAEAPRTHYTLGDVPYIHPPVPRKTPLVNQGKILDQLAGMDEEGLLELFHQKGFNAVCPVSPLPYRLFDLFDRCGIMVLSSQPRQKIYSGRPAYPHPSEISPGK